MQRYAKCGQDHDVTPDEVALLADEVMLHRSLDNLQVLDPTSRPAWKLLL